MSKPRRQRRPRYACPLCAEPRFNHALPHAIPLGIPTYWSPQTALAVFDLVDQIRDIILAVYSADIQQASRQERQPSRAEEPDITEDELPF
jgi:hypothetical protein